MIRNYIKIAFRNALKNKTFSLINVFGLAIGLAAAMATLLFVKKEISFDTFHKNYDNIYQVGLNASFDGKNFEKWSQSPNKVGPYLKQNLPEIKHQTRILHHEFGQTAFVTSGEKHFTEKKLYFADPTILDIFDFNFKEGNPKTALARPNTVIISSATAKRYFGDQSPMGKTLKIDNAIDVEVTGVFDDFAGYTHLDYDILGSFDTIKWASRPDNQSWSNASFETFVLLNPNANVQQLDRKIAAAISKESPRKNRFYDVFLRPMSEVYLHSADYANKVDAPYGNAQQTHILIALTIALLLIASINYMNLSTARLQRSFREVGINKSLGATFGQMVRRFYTETFLYVTIGLLLSICLLATLLPLLNALIEETLSLNFLKQSWFWVILLAIWLFIIVLSGAYPALIFSRFSPKFMLQTNNQPKSGSSIFRKSLVVFQFVASIVLIITVIVFQLQLKFLSDKNLGFKPEQVVAVLATNLTQTEQYDALENEFRNLSAVKQAAYTQSFSGMSTSLRTIQDDKNPSAGIKIYTCRTRPEILETMGIKLLAGKMIDKKLPTDTLDRLVINRTAAKSLGLTPEQAVGKKIKVFNDYGDEVVGVVEDFHFQTMHETIMPYAFHNARTEGYSYLMVRLSSDDLVKNMASLEAVYKKNIPNSAFEYLFVDAHLENLYRAEKRISKIINVFAFLAIFIACLGLFGLATFSAEVRTKEIGIRKVLGASVLGITALLSKDFLKLVLIAIVLASPLAYYTANNWLKNFAYRIHIEWWMFVVSGVIVALIALLTVSYQAIKAALANPVESLKTE
ncbi:MAG: ABC transporter permease [Cytophagia bacterium]|nr:MAG: ABC transporter permease [Cytophagales bacterium]TAG38683.1 MAG: ABC transporter permease [Cytophagia bacterium]